MYFSKGGWWWVVYHVACLVLLLHHNPDHPPFTDSDLIFYSGFSPIRNALVCTTAVFFFRAHSCLVYCNNLVHFFYKTKKLFSFVDGWVDVTRISKTAYTNPKLRKRKKLHNQMFRVNRESAFFEGNSSKRVEEKTVLI